MFERSQLSWLGPSPIVACAAVRPEFVASVVKLVRDMAFKIVIPLMTKPTKDRRPAIRSVSDDGIYLIEGGSNSSNPKVRSDTRGYAFACACGWCRIVAAPSAIREGREQRTDNQSHDQGKDDMLRHRAWSGLVVDHGKQLNPDSVAATPSAAERP